MGNTTNRADLIDAVVDGTGLQKSVATSAVDAVFKAIERSLKEKVEVRLTGFGSFVVAERKASKGRHPRTGEEIDVPASTSVRFKPGKGLKDAVA